jgi:hypothetical protein
MSKRELVSGKTENAISVADLRFHANDWLTDCQLRQHSSRTIKVRHIFINNLLWFLDKRGYTECGTPQLRDFFRYLAEGYTEPGGRWGNARNNRSLRPITIKDYHTVLRV